MYSLTDLCSLCLVHSKSIKSILSEDSDGVSVKNKIEFIITEVTNFKSEVISNICTDCLTGLNYVYKFKQKCLQNFTTLNAYVEQMASKNEEFNYSASTSTIENHFMTNITEKYAVKEEPKDSDDNMENNYNSSLFTQTFEESTMKDETKSTAMSNNAEYIEGQSSVSKNRVPENNEEPVIVKQELGYIQDEVDTKDDPLLPDDDDTEEMPDEATNNSDCDPLSSGKKLFKCDVCNKTFPTSWKLKTHIRVHTGERPFKCPTCHKAYTQTHHLKSHMMTHTGEKPHVCDICSKGFNEMKNLSTHKRIHNNERPFKCLVCEKTFTQSVHLTEHMRTHTGHKPHHCPICTYKCAQTSSLKKHMQVHNSDKKYKCEYCHRGFSQKGNLRTHVRKLHPNRPLLPTYDTL